MRLTGFRQKGLKQIHAGDIGKGIPAAMADKLRKLLFALERPTVWIRWAGFQVGSCIR